MILAAGDPVEHVLPHGFFELFSGNLNFGAQSIPLLGFPLSNTFWFTNHLLMTLVAAGLCLLIFPLLARRYATVGGEPVAPRGVFANFFEALLQFIREEVARPVLKERTDRYIPILWTLFFFILFCNVLGLVPLADIIYLLSGRKLEHVGGTATGNLAITGGLALCAFFMFHISGVREAYQNLLRGGHGHGHDDAGHDGHGHARHEEAAGMPVEKAAFLAVPTYIWNFAPHAFAKHGPRKRVRIVLRVFMCVLFAAIAAAECSGFFQLFAGATGRTVGVWFGVIAGLCAGIRGGGLHWTDVLDVVMWAFLLVLELVGAIIKPFSLMIRLFANMVAGHIVVGSILMLIFTTNTVVMGYTTGAISSLGCLALSLLELFVAFLQAYIFVFLSTLFLGMSVAPEH